MVFVHRWSLFRGSVSETHCINVCQFDQSMVSRHILEYSVIIKNPKIVKHFQSLLLKEPRFDQRDVVSIDSHR